MQLDMQLVWEILLLIIWRSTALRSGDTFREFKPLRETGFKFPKSKDGSLVF